MSNPTMTIADTNGGNGVVIGLPQFGYTTNIRMGLVMNPKYGATYSIYDRGVANDQRSCSFTLLLDVTDENELQDLLFSSTAGRGSQKKITLTAGCGFFPFGPDKGDTGAFNVSILPYAPEGVKSSPHQFFRAEITMIATSFPVYSVPADVSDYGSLTIDSIADIGFPAGYFKPDSRFNYDVALPLGATTGIDTLDKGEASDRYDSSFTVNCREAKAANLLYQLTTSTRGTGFTMTTGAGAYPFGRLPGASGNFTCTLADRKSVV